MFNNLFLIFGISEKISKFLYAILAVIGVLLLIKILIKNEESRGWIFGIIVFVAFCSALVCGFKIYQYATVKGGTVGDFIHSLVSSSSAEKISDYTFKFNKVAFSPTGNENEYKVTIEEVYKQTDESGNETIGSFDLDLTKNWNIYVNDSNTNNTVKGTNYINAEYIYSFYNEDLQHILTDTLKIKFVFYKNYYRVDLITTGGELAVDFWESYIYKEGLTVGLKINEYVHDTEIRYESISFSVSPMVETNGQNIEWETENSNVFLNIYYCNDYEGSYASHIEDTKHTHNFVLLNRIELVVNSVVDIEDAIESFYSESLTLGKEGAVYYFEIDNQNPYISLNESKIEMQKYFVDYIYNETFGFAQGIQNLKTVNEVAFINSCYCNLINYESISCYIKMTFDYEKYRRDPNPSIHFDIIRTAGLYETDTNTLTKFWEQLLEDRDITFENGKLKVENADLAGDLVCGSVKGLTSLSDAFRSRQKLTSIDLSNLDTSNVTDMKEMFMFSNGLKSIVFGDNFKTNNVTDMNNMFTYCSSLTELNLTNFNTSNVRNMGSMFSYCSKLINLDLSSFDTRRVEYMSFMFEYCESLINLDLSSFDTYLVTSMYAMFRSCNSLTSLDLSNFDTRNVTSMYYIFDNCLKLKSLDVSNFVIGKNTDITGFFSGKDISSLKLCALNGYSDDGVTILDLHRCLDLKSIEYAGNKKSWNSIEVIYPYPYEATVDSIIIKCSDGDITKTLK